jgi:hypothetical protein
MYVIINPRLGTPGEPFEPIEGINVDALLEAGFIAHADGAERGKKKIKNSSTQE